MTTPAGEFTPRVAIVTGASQGIGRATALALADRGVQVTVAARTNSNLMVVKNQIEERGGRALAVPTDVSEANQVERMVRKTEESLGEIDVLINNAGIVERHPLTDTTDESWQRVLDINLKGVFLCTRAVLPGMTARRRGRILNLSSISGKLGTRGLAAYCASKWGILGLTKATAEEVRPNNILVVALCPGSVATEMLGRGLPGAEPQMTPENVASFLVYLATEAPKAVTGAAIDMFG